MNILECWWIAQAATVAVAPKAATTAVSAAAASLPRLAAPALHGGQAARIAFLPCPILLHTTLDAHIGRPCGRRSQIAVQYFCKRNRMDRRLPTVPFCFDGVCGKE